MLYFRLFILLAALAFALPATAQDCTLASTAECNGVPCAGETRPEGRIVYNTDYEVAQICQDGIWVALHPFDAASPCPGAGLVGHWKLNESGNVSTAADSAGSNDGTLTNFPADPSANWVAGKLGNALDFDGSDDYVNIAHNASLNVGNSFSWSAWAYIRSLPGSGVFPNIISKRPSGSAPWWDVVLDGDNSGRFSFAVNTGLFRDNSPTVIPSTNTWYHLVGTYDGSEIRFYINGAEDTSDTGTTTTTGSPDNSASLQIGFSGASGTDVFDGLMDDVRIYNIALDEDEVEALYNGGAGCQ